MKCVAVLCAGHADMNEGSGLGSSLALHLRGLSVSTQKAGAYGTLATTVQLKGLNLDVMPASTQSQPGQSCCLAA